VRDGAEPKRNGGELLGRQWRGIRGVRAQHAPPVGLRRQRHPQGVRDHPGGGGDRGRRLQEGVHDRRHRAASASRQGDEEAGGPRDPFQKDELVSA